LGLRISARAAGPVPLSNLSSRRNLANRPRRTSHRRTASLSSTWS